ncbi:universal stress protein [Gloeothece verrucosa]|uniref:UspA domain protein n=1 Tax=Gloeothece verrucosa (strain PCC 7822) TaxID=497965 RepID=E0UAR8_GLOV7|nr:universal stress protein [Gloeothece verrucosa]ADN13920.1 UspA domain protein [Gloeothece verrucosa PCC 7822]
MSLLPKNRILVPIDFSEASFQALDETLAFVDDPAQIYVVHVLVPISPVEPGVIWAVINDQTRKQNVEKVFDQKYQEFIDQGIHFDVLIGDAGTEIVNYAEKHNIELIVIPSHGRTGLSRLLLGSVAERVARCSHCPVLILRRHGEMLG